jgi:hypothetical protein
MTNNNGYQPKPCGVQCDAETIKLIDEERQRIATREDLVPSRAAIVRRWARRAATASK